MAVVRMPLLLREVTGGARRVEVGGSTLGEVVAELDRVYPGIEARVHNDHMDCTGRKIWSRRLHDEGSLQEVLGAYLMRNIYNCCRWVNRQNHALHYPHIFIFQTKISQ